MGVARHLNQEAAKTVSLSDLAANLTSAAAIGGATSLGMSALYNWSFFLSLGAYREDFISLSDVTSSALTWIPLVVALTIIGAALLIFIIHRVDLRSVDEGKADRWFWRFFVVLFLLVTVATAVLYLTTGENAEGMIAGCVSLGAAMSILAFDEKLVQRGFAPIQIVVGAIIFLALGLPLMLGAMDAMDAMLADINSTLTIVHTTDAKRNQSGPIP